MSDNSVIRIDWSSFEENSLKDNRWTAHLQMICSQPLFPNEYSKCEKKGNAYHLSKDDPDAMDEDDAFDTATALLQQNGFRGSGTDYGPGSDTFEEGFYDIDGNEVGESGPNVTEDGKKQRVG
ncbi:MAG: hypothetical protein Q9159_003120 [Coniocarpon cinnabarinum]